MADNNFRFTRSRDSVAPEGAARDGASDPLAELARLIGQSDPYREAAGQYDSAQSDDGTTTSGLDWAADESYAEQHDLAQDRRVSPPSRVDSYSYPPQDRHPPQERDYDGQAPGSGRFFSGPAAKFRGLSEDADAAADDARYDERALNSPYESPAFASGAPDDRYEADEDRNSGQAYPADVYEEGTPSPRRRSGFVVVAAVLGLAVLGSAGAFAYRTMFGRSMLSALPPIIKPAVGPNKIMPNYGDSQASNSNQAGAAGAGTAEKLVSHEEQPVDVQATPQAAAPRVVSTVPIIGPSEASPFAAIPAAPADAAPAPVVASAAAFAAAPAPAAVPPAQMAAPPLPPAPASAAVLPEPKKIHTVTIRADQANGAKTAANVPPPAARSTAHATARVPKPSKRATRPASPNEPLSLVPTAQGDAYAAPPPRTAVRRTTVASAAPLAITGAATTRSTGGYAVQVTSRRSEAEAQSAYHALQAKFPDQLGEREPIIRRADLGAKGTYYRALVGPFASMEEAARVCSSLKAAGGNCLVQKD